MGKLIVSTQMSLDAVIEVGDWFAGGGDSMAVGLARLRDASAVLLGRKTYEGLASYWSSTSGDWADVINPAPKYVASRTLDGPLEWNSTLLDGDPMDAVARLKAESPSYLLSYGCGELARSLFAAGLVDELHVGIHPTIWGAGARPLLGEGPVRLRLLGAESFESGVTLLRYAPAGNPRHPR